MALRTSVFAGVLLFCGLYAWSDEGGVSASGRANLVIDETSHALLTVGRRIHSLALSPAGDHVCIACDGKTGRSSILSLKSADKSVVFSREYPGLIAGVEFINEGKDVVVLSVELPNKRLELFNSHVEIVNASNGAVRLKAKWPLIMPSSLAVSPDGAIIAACGIKQMVGNSEAELKVWNAATLDEVSTLNGSGRPPFGAPRRPSQNDVGAQLSGETPFKVTFATRHVIAVDFGKDLDFISTESWMRMPRLWAAEDGKIIRIRSVDSGDVVIIGRKERVARRVVVGSEAGRRVAGLRAGAEACDVDSPSTSILATEGNKVLLYNYETRVEHQEIDIGVTLAGGQVSLDGHVVAAYTQDGTVHLWSTNQMRGARSGDSIATKPQEIRDFLQFFTAARSQQDAGHHIEAARLFQAALSHDRPVSWSREEECLLLLRFADTLASLSRLTDAEAILAKCRESASIGSMPDIVVRCQRAQSVLDVRQGKWSAIAADVRSIVDNADKIPVNLHLSRNGQIEFATWCADLALATDSISSAADELGVSRDQLDEAFSPETVKRLLSYSNQNEFTRSVDVRCIFATAKIKSMLLAGDVTGASKLCEKSIDDVSKWSPDVFDLRKVDFYFSWGDVCAYNGKRKAAIDIYTQCVDMLRRKTGSSGLQISRVRLALIQAEAEEGLWDDAFVHMQDALLGAKATFATASAHMTHLQRLQLSYELVYPAASLAVSLSHQRRGEQKWASLGAEALFNLKSLALEHPGPRAGGDKCGVAPSHWVTVDEVRKELRPGELFVDIADVAHSDGPSSSQPSLKARKAFFAFVIPAAGEGEIHQVLLADSSRIEQDVIAFLASLRSPAARAGAIVLPDILHAAIRRATHLIVSPDSAMWRLPWEAIQMRENRYLIEDTAVSYVHSARDLFCEVATVFKSGEVYVHQPQSLGRGLMQAESQLIERTLSAMTNDRVQSFDIERLQAGTRADILVAVTHGWFEEEDDADFALWELVDKSRTRSRGFHLSITPPPVEMLSALTNVHPKAPFSRCGLVSDTGKSSGKAGLTGEHIAAMDCSHTRLVVLAECKTGVGRLQPLEGPAGIREAFILAGADSVVASLWDIPDRESAMLMRAFWTRMAAGCSPAIALQKAKNEVISGGRKEIGFVPPYYWAGITITGR